MGLGVLWLLGLLLLLLWGFELQGLGDGAASSHT